MTAKKEAAASNWASRFTRDASASTTENETPVKPAPKKAPQRPRKAATEPVEPVAAPVAPAAVPVASRSRRGPAKHPVTYRLTDDVLDMVDAAVAVAAEKGERLTKEEAVAVAIRRAYGRLLR